MITETKEDLAARVAALEAHEAELMKKWAADDHEARMLRFALADIELAANTEGRAAIAHMAAEARSKSIQYDTEVRTLMNAIEECIDGNGETQATLLDALAEAFKPFRDKR